MGGFERETRGRSKRTNMFHESRSTLDHILAYTLYSNNKYLHVDIFINILLISNKTFYTIEHDNLLEHLQGLGVPCRLQHL